MITILCQQRGLFLNPSPTYKKGTSGKIMKVDEKQNTYRATGNPNFLGYQTNV